MALLEQTDRQWSAGAARREEDLAEAEAPELVEDDADADAEPEAAGKGVVAGCCCVCMARAKGAAFIPCGHTFCRACARELLAGRGHCSLCNAVIVGVLIAAAAEGMRTRRRAAGEGRRSGELGRAEGLVGTPHHVAPEVVADGEYGAQADVWSAGW